MTALRTDVATDIDEFEALAPPWWRLWERCPATTPFQSPAWLIAWWRSFAPGELRVIAVWRGDELTGLAPLYLENSHLGRRLLPIGISVSDYLDLIVAPEDADDIGAAIAVQLAAMPDWDSCDLSDLGPEACALHLPCPPRCESAVETGESCPVLVLPSAPDGLAQVVPTGQRRDARQARNRLARHHRARIGAAANDRAADMVALLVGLHRARWESRGEPGVLADPRIVRFHQEAVPRLARRHLVRFHYVTIDGRTVAVQYSLAYRERWFAYLSGFDPAFAFESPGTVLIESAIEQAIAEGAREFHFLRGREPYKFRWGAVDRWNCRRVFKPVLIHAECA
jgi:CelD/BcsL family acetyltransferase involved in cellulose biosynthesis